MREPKRRQTIKEWELETGIKVIDPKGFTNWNGKSRTLTNKYTKEQFRKSLEKSIITITTEKGMDFYEGKDIFDEYWRSYVRVNEQKKSEVTYGKYRNKKVTAEYRHIK